MAEIAACSFAYTLLTLGIWGRWSLCRIGGYPAASSHVPRVRGRGEPPTGVMAVDAVLGAIGRDRDERHLQRRIFTHYHRDSGIRELVRRLGISTATYYDQLEEAQWAVHVRLSA